MTDHRPIQFYAEAGSAPCPHGTDGNQDRHAPGGEIWICLDAPIGDGCDTCTDDYGYGLMWADSHPSIAPSA